MNRWISLVGFLLLTRVGVYGGGSPGVPPWKYPSDPTNGQTWAYSSVDGAWEPGAPGTTTYTASGSLVAPSGVFSLSGDNATPGNNYQYGTNGSGTKGFYQITLGSTVLVLGTATTSISGLTLVAPVLGTPTSVTLTNGTGLPVATGISGLGTGVGTFLATPSSANLAAALTDETGTGAAVFGTSPTLVTPALGTPASGTLTNCTFPTLNQNTTGTAANLSGTPALPNGTTATTQTVGDNTAKLATDAFVIANAASAGVSQIVAGTNITISPLGGTGVVTINSSGGGGGSGTVTTFSSGNLAPLFTTSVATATTTPVLTFSLTSAAQNLVFASPNGSSGAGAYRALVAADVPTLNQSTTGTASNLSGTPALPNGTTATTQTVGDNSAKLATTAFVIANVGSGSGNVSTSGSITTGTVAVFNASTTVVGTQTAPSGTFVGTTDTQTLSSKRISRRTVSVSDATSITPNGDTTDILTQTNTQAQGALTINAPTGTPVNGDTIEFWITSTNPETLTFNAIYTFSADLPKPPALTGSGKEDKFKVVWKAATSNWQYIGRNFGY